MGMWKCSVVPNAALVWTVSFVCLASSFPLLNNTHILSRLAPPLLWPLVQMLLPPSLVTLPSWMQCTAHPRRWANNSPLLPGHSSWSRVGTGPKLGQSPSWGFFKMEFGGRCLPSCVAVLEGSEWKPLAGRNQSLVRGNTAIM